MALVTHREEIMNACQEDWDDMVPATEGPPNSINKMELFSYKGE